MNADACMQSQEPFQETHFTSSAHTFNATAAANAGGLVAFTDSTTRDIGSPAMTNAQAAAKFSVPVTFQTSDVTLSTAVASYGGWVSIGTNPFGSDLHGSLAGRPLSGLTYSPLGVQACWTQCATSPDHVVQSRTFNVPTNHPVYVSLQLGTVAGSFAGGRGTTSVFPVFWNQ